MKKRLKKLRNLFVQIKVYFARTSGYIGMINSAMILFLLLSNLEKYGIDIRITDWMIPIIILWIIFMVLFGYLEDKLGFYAQEKKTTESRSPHFKEIIQKLNNIDTRLTKIEKKLKK